ncbi:MAG: hypothetical protein ACD_83C00281G0002 [uncultured bacterium]|uniref:Glycerophosphoryl diester phosphodiesterase membrane domain-containing protein n=1 Tax=Berkelbacteria bacterium GW2011_GWA2_38_9 TaxID=1618334 RepID=A0A0G0LCA3_9BACT|nr:MAG: hypothetical protein ACD_83C00281G0002 [uncultured bacterium]KKQ89603.1 MAG: hypothetical protein UT11_C0022G0006 [Berkelbacteria bacterium GW2011_GWA2_38_9]
MNNPTLNYGKLVRTSWDIVKKHPYLWILGILAGSGGGGTGYNFSDYSNKNMSGSKSTTFNSVKHWFGEVAGASTDKWQQYADTGIITTFVVIMLIVVILFMIIAVIFRGGLIRSVVNISKGIEGNFSKAWHLGLETWRPLFWLHIILLLVVMAAIMPIVVLIVLATISLTAKVIAIIGGVIWVILLLLFMLAIGLIFPFTERILVLEQLSPIESVTHGIDFFKKHWKEGLTIYALNIGLSCLYLIFIVLAILALAVPIVLIYFVFHTISAPVGVVIVSLLILAALILLVVVQGFFGAFTSTIYTGAYVALNTHFKS